MKMRQTIGRLALAAVVAVPTLWARERPAPREEKSDQIAYLGVAALSVDPALARHLKLRPGTGLSVVEVDPDSAAASVLQEEDILKDLNGQILINSEQFTTLVRLQKPGDEVSLTLLREGETKTVKVKLGGREAPPAVASGRAWGQPWSMSPGWAEQLEQWMQQQHQGLRGWGRTPAGPPPAAPDEEPGISTSFSTTVTIEEDGSQATLTEDENGRNFKATDAKGKVLFDGPVKGEDDVKKMPEAARELYRKISKSADIRIERSGPNPNPNPKPERKPAPGRVDA